MLRTWLSKTCDPTFLQYPSQFHQYVNRIGNVMKGIQTHDSIYALVCKLDVTTVKLQELRRGPVTKHGLALVSLGLLEAPAPLVAAGMVGW